MGALYAAFPIGKTLLDKGGLMKFLEARSPIYAQE